MSWAIIALFGIYFIASMIINFPFAFVFHFNDPNFLDEYIFSNNKGSAKTFNMITDKYEFVYNVFLIQIRTCFSYTYLNRSIFVCLGYICQKIFKKQAFWFEIYYKKWIHKKISKMDSKIIHIILLFFVYNF